MVKHHATKELSTEHRLIHHIESRNGYVIKNQATAMTGQGKPDLSACLNGHYVAIEVKREDNQRKTKWNQILNLAKVAKAGGYAYISCTEDCLKDTTHGYHSSTILVTDITTLSKVSQLEMLTTIKHLLRDSDFAWIEFQFLPESNQHLVTFVRKESVI